MVLLFLFEKKVKFGRAAEPFFLIKKKQIHFTKYKMESQLSKKKSKESKTKMGKWTRKLAGAPQSAGTHVFVHVCVYFCVS